MAVKMKLVPVDAPSAVDSFAGFQEDVEKKGARSLQSEMRDILHAPDIPDDRKVKMYQVLMERMLRYMDMSRDKLLPVTVHPAKPEGKPEGNSPPTPLPGMDILLEKVPESSQQRGRRLLEHLKKHMAWDGESKTLVYKDSRIPHEEARELVRDVVSGRRPRSQPGALNTFLQTLAETDVPHVVVKRKQLRARLQSRSGARGEATTPPPTAPAWRPY